MNLNIYSLPALKWENGKQNTKGNHRWEKKKGAENARTHPRDGSLSISNPTRVLDTLSGYNWKGK